ncbi:hypothetical protein EDC01DRAFT_42838 [Geopyxis carbonaria]|nr:hypothetical protein EDC01DRAFT_42838 [Geopyxis carbonaria]
MSATYVATASGKGSGLFASKPLDAHQEILSVVKPLGIVPEDGLVKEVCSNCMVWRSADAKVSAYYTNTTPLLRCSGCKVVHYCSRDCQKEDFKYVHKAECQIFQRLNPKELPATIRMVIRLILTLDDSQWKQVKELQSHIAGFAQDKERWDMMKLMAKGSHAYSGTRKYSEAEILELYCRVILNTLTLTTPTLDPIGLYFDPKISLVNHSCVSNAAVTFEGRTLHLRSAKPIAQDEEITITYADPTYPTYVRQRELEEIFFFSCRCPMCSQAPDLHTDTYTCSFCSGPIVPNIDPPECSQCEREAPHLLRKLQIMEARGTQAAKSGSSGDVVASLKELYESKMFPAHRQPLPALHASAVDKLLRANEYGDAFQHYLLLYTRVDPKNYPPFHPILVCRGFVLSALLTEVASNPPPILKELEIDWPKAIYAVLIEVEKGAKKSHGEDSGFAKFVTMKKQGVWDELKIHGMQWAQEKDAPIEGFAVELAKVDTIVDRLMETLTNPLPLTYKT